MYTPCSPNLLKFIQEKKGWKAKRFFSDILNFYALGTGLYRPIPFRVRYPDYK